MAAKPKALKDILGRPKPIEIPDDYDEPDFRSWSAKLDAFVPKAAGGSENANANVPATPVAADVSSGPVVAELPSSTGTLAETLTGLLSFDGAICAALVDSDSGMILGQSGSVAELELAAAGASVMLRARRATVKTLGTAEEVADILVTLTSQLHIIRPLTQSPSVFIYLIVDRAKSSLAMARYKATEADGALVL